jgi:hypothetical protein
MWGSGGREEGKGERREVRMGGDRREGRDGRWGKRREGRALVAHPPFLC